MFTKAYLTAIAVLSALVLALGGFAYWQTKASGKLTEQNHVLTEALTRAQEEAKRIRGISTARQAKIVLQGRKLAQAQEALSEALQRNKSWSDTDVPTDVQKALKNDPSGSDFGPPSLSHAPDAR